MPPVDRLVTSCLARVIEGYGVPLGALLSGAVHSVGGSGGAFLVVALRSSESDAAVFGARWPAKGKSWAVGSAQERRP